MESKVRLPFSCFLSFGIILGTCSLRKLWLISCYCYYSHYFIRAVVLRALNGPVTGVTYQQFQISDIDIMFITVAKLKLWSSHENNLLVGVHKKRTLHFRKVVNSMGISQKFLINSAVERLLGCLQVFIYYKNATLRNYIRVFVWVFVWT